MKFKRHRKKADTLQVEKKPFFMPNRKVLTKEGPHSSGIKVSSPGDKSEKQADAVADQVVKNKDHSQINQKLSEDKSPLVQTAADKEEEPAAKHEVQKQEDEEPAAKLEIQRQEDEEPAAKLKVQRQEESPFARRSTKPDGEVDKASEDKEEAQAKSMIQRKEGESNVPLFETRVKSAKTGGVPLPENIKKEMEQKLKTNFGKVRIHTNDEAINLCREIKAQAFTNGYHIFFNKGKFNPESSSGKHLLAHELTHVIQQKGR